MSNRIRNVAIVGPYLSGKTTLLESLLFVTGAISRKGNVQDGNTVGDSVPEAVNRQMSVEVVVATTHYGAGDDATQFNFLDCPGSVEFVQETCNALMGVDAALVVCEPEPERVLALAPLLQFLDRWEIPHLLFINKLDRDCANFVGVCQALKAVSRRPLALQQYPIGQGAKLTGFIDLITEQAYQYHPGSAPDPVPLPEDLRAEEQQARAEMLETLANFDDHLLEELLEEIEPPQEEIWQDLRKDLSADRIVPVFLGVAQQDFGVRPLLAALAQEVPDPMETAERRGINLNSQEPLAQVLKTNFSSQGGRLSLVRVWRGQINEGVSLNNMRLGGIARLCGQRQTNLQTAQAGDIVALSRMEGVRTGDTLRLNVSTRAQTLPTAEVIAPVYALAVSPVNRNDEVKLSAATTKLIEEDPGLRVEQNSETHEIIFWGQGDIHIQVALDRVRRKFNLPLEARLPQIAYRSTIRKSTEVHGRYKHQTGGHGQFGDVHLTIKPLARGEGEQFSETIVGGAVPRQYIPGVEMGVREFLAKGSIGYPVVDIAVTLTNGSYHSVDSSEQAFKQAARIAMQEGLPKCEPVLLEPVDLIEVAIPQEFTPRVLRLVSGRRGQLLNYQAREGWSGWDMVTAHLPQAELNDFVIELRSLSLGVGLLTWQFDHLQEIPEKVAERVLVASK
ncbi:elongation factor G [Leptolyngbya sp. FACHB-261]|uniref:elongation factor G n=1 Tax=Leptolyngbya sp. FACHB-261 TaxID=2692806 RepID=UPI001689CA26|nr:elongation factor G [Leptolyngbya sp. FACHB-261]MBD2104860.1 elongation factor G [Leptolyngbya sp. FACHB-261]